MAKGSSSADGLERYPENFNQGRLSQIKIKIETVFRDSLKQKWYISFINIYLYSFAALLSHAINNNERRATNDDF